MAPGDDFEREKWAEELELRKREVAIKERENSSAQWKNPILVSIVSAAVAGTIGILANHFDSQSKIALEERKSDLALLTSLIKSDDKTVVSDNLRFLVDAKVIRNEELRGDLAAYLENTSVSELPAISTRLINRGNVAQVDVCKDIADPQTSIQFEPLTPAEQGAIAAEFDLEPAVLQAYLEVEAPAGRLPRGHPRILFERTFFSRLTQHRFDEAHAEISAARPGGYRPGYGEYARMTAAAALDCDAALMSASWGAAQIMGSHFEKAGFGDVKSFARAMLTSERDSLRATMTFIKQADSLDELRAKDWAGFARRYNGPNFRQQGYDVKLREAYQRSANQET